MKKVISTNNAPAAIGPYSQAIEVNGVLYISGQIPINPATGKIAEDNVTEQAEQVFANIKAILTEAGYGFENVVKSTVFIADMAIFAELNENCFIPIKEPSSKLNFNSTEVMRFST